MRISDWSSDVCSSDLSEATQRRLLSGIDEFACNARKLARSRLVFLSQGQIIARSDAERELDTDLSGEIGVRDGKTIIFRPQFGFGERHSCAPAASKIESLVDRDGGFGAVEARISSGSEIVRANV